MQIAIACPYPPYDGVPHAGGAFLHSYITIFQRTTRLTSFAPQSLSREP